MSEQAHYRIIEVLIRNENKKILCLGHDNINSTQRDAKVDMKTKREVMEGKKIVRLKKKKVVKIKKRGEHE